MEMSQIHDDEDKDGTESTEMHDNPLHDADEEHGQVKKDEEEYASENVTADESYVESIGDDDDVGTEVNHLYKDRVTDIVPMQLNPMLNPEDMRNHKDNTVDVQAENMELKSKNANLEFATKSLKEENQVLQQRVQDLESQMEVQNKERNDNTSI